MVPYLLWGRAEQQSVIKKYAKGTRDAKLSLREHGDLPGTRLSEFDLLFCLAGSLLRWWVKLGHGGLSRRNAGDLAALTPVVETTG